MKKDTTIAVIAAIVVIFILVWKDETSTIQSVYTIGPADIEIEFRNDDDELIRGCGIIVFENNAIATTDCNTGEFIMILSNVDD